MFFPIGKKIDWHRKTGPSPKNKKRLSPVTRNLSSHYHPLCGICSIGLLSPFYFCLFCIVYSSIIIRCTELGFGDFGIRSVYICKQVTKCQT